MAAIMFSESVPSAKYFDRYRNRYRNRTNRNAILLLNTEKPISDRDMLDADSDTDSEMLGLME